MLTNNVYERNVNNGIYFTALPKKYKVVDEALIRGPHPGICDVFRLKKEGVTQIYDFRHFSVRGAKTIERLACKIAGIDYKRRAFSFLEGTYPTLQDYEAISKSVKDNAQKGGKTLFHCNSGTHRTSLMSAFYRITHGESLSKCKKQSGYSENVDKILKEEVSNAHYFSRNKAKKMSKNPVIRLINIFNNNVQNATQKAYDLFLDIVKG